MTRQHYSGKLRSSRANARIRERDMYEIFVKTYRIDSASGTPIETALKGFSKVTFLAAIIASTFGVAQAEPGEQSIVREVAAAQGWTSVVPMELNGDGLTDLLSYNATTGRAIYSIGTSVPGEQEIVKDVAAAKGWTLVVPIELNGDGLTDLLSYNRTTGQAIYSVAD
jgi:hypothetical protein